METQHKFKVGDKVVYTNPQGVCWGVKTIIALDDRTYDMWGDVKCLPTYHYEGSDTPWYSVSEECFVLADDKDIAMSAEPDDNKRNRFFQKKYGK